MTLAEHEPRILSIQSHVVRGYVGNKMAVFPLQLLGMDVDSINSVHFSNHMGYEHFTGKHLRLTDEDVHELLDGLEKNGLLCDAYRYLLIGFVGSESLLKAIVQVYHRLLAHASDSKKLSFVCDPVLGDSGKLYVPQELVEIYRQEIVPLADVLTPNQFECEALSLTTLESVEDACNACKILHRLGPKVVVITSFSDRVSKESGELLIIASRWIHDTNYCEQYKLCVRHVQRDFAGTGDLFTALLLAWLDRIPHYFPTALEYVVSSIQDVIHNTLRLDPQSPELKLIQSRRYIMEPELRYTAVALSRPVISVIIDLDLYLTEAEVETQSSCENVCCKIDACSPATRFQRFICKLNEIVSHENVFIVSRHAKNEALGLLNNFVGALGKNIEAEQILAQSLITLLEQNHASEHLSEAVQNERLSVNSTLYIVSQSLSSRCSEFRHLRSRVCNFFDDSYMQVIDEIIVSNKQAAMDP